MNYEVLSYEKSHENKALGDDHDCVALLSCGGPLVPFDISITPPREGLVGEWLLDGDYSDSANPSTITTLTDTNNSFSVWARTSMTNFTADHDIAGFDTSGGFYATMAYHTGTTKLSSVLGIPGVGGDIAPGVSVSKNRWQHFVMAYQDSTAKVYDNGDYEDRVGFNPLRYPSGYPTLPAVDFRIGVNNGGPDLVALVDDVRVYNRALTEDEIQRLYHEKGYGY